jgi:hypothetical protein
MPQGPYREPGSGLTAWLAKLRDLEEHHLLKRETAIHRSFTQMFHEVIKKVVSDRPPPERTLVESPLHDHATDEQGIMEHRALIWKLRRGFKVRDSEEILIAVVGHRTHMLLNSALRRSTLA